MSIEKEGAVSKVPQVTLIFWIIKVLATTNLPEKPPRPW